MRKIVHRVDAPFVACAVVRRLFQDAVHNRVTHIDIAGGHVDFRAQDDRAGRELAIFHALKKVKAFFNGAVAVR